MMMCLYYVSLIITEQYSLNDTKRYLSQSKSSYDKNKTTFCYSANELKYLIIFNRIDFYVSTISFLIIYSMKNYWYNILYPKYADKNISLYTNFRWISHSGAVVYIQTPIGCALLRI